MVSGRLGRRLAIRGGLVGVAALIALLGAACGGGDGGDADAAANGGGSTSGTGSSAGNGSGSGVAVPARTAQAEVTSAVVTFEPAEGSSAAGTATLEQDGGRAQVSVTMTGLPAGAHALYVSQGTCDSGARIGPLTPLEADAGGEAESVTPLVARVDSLVGGHLVVYEGETASSDAIIACGEIVAGEAEAGAADAGDDGGDAEDEADDAASEDGDESASDEDAAGDGADESAADDDGADGDAPAEGEE